MESLNFAYIVEFNHLGSCAHWVQPLTYMNYEYNEGFQVPRFRCPAWTCPSLSQILIQWFCGYNLCGKENLKNSIYICKEVCN